MRAFVLILLLSLAGCNPHAPEVQAGDQFINTASITCGSTDYDDVTRTNVIQRYTCLSNLQRRILMPTLPYPDLYEQSLALRRVYAEQFAAGKISKAEFLAHGAQINSQLIGQTNNRIAQENASTQPIYVPQATNWVPPARQRIHCDTNRLGYSVTTDCY